MFTLHVGITIKVYVHFGGVLGVPSFTFVSATKTTKTSMEESLAESRIFDFYLHGSQSLYKAATKATKVATKPTLVATNTTMVATMDATNATMVATKAYLIPTRSHSCY